MSAPGRGVKRTLVGRRMPMGSLEDERLPRWVALPIFASDPLSSVADATEAGLVVLVATSLTSCGLIVPISGGHRALLAIVVLSYRQTIFALKPYYTLSIETGRGVGAFLVYAAVAMLVAVVAGRLRQARTEADLVHPPGAGAARRRATACSPEWRATMCCACTCSTSRTPWA